MVVSFNEKAADRYGVIAAVILYRFNIRETFTMSELFAQLPFLGGANSVNACTAMIGDGVLKQTGEGFRIDIEKYNQIVNPELNQDAA